MPLNQTIHAFNCFSSFSEKETYVCEASGAYRFLRPVSADEIIFKAKALLSARLMKPQVPQILSFSELCDFLLMELSLLESEVFCAIFFDTKCAVIAFEKLFYGSIHSAQVYPREVVKAALKHNAASAIFVHNHPSGNATASHEDKVIASILEEVFKWIDVKVIQHLIVAGNKVAVIEQ